MGKLKLEQWEIDKLVVSSRVSVKPSGAGSNDVAFQIRNSGHLVWQYKLWKNMLQRCFDAEYKARQPTYEDVTCCDDWLSFGNFFEWLNKEVGYSGKPVGMQLDKDLLIRGNLVYRPEACSLVPRSVNSVLLSNDSERGEWPVGVYLHKQNNRFIARLNHGGKLKHIGCYATAEEAFAAYKSAKEDQIRVVALQHKELLKPAVFESLMNWSV